MHHTQSLLTSIMMSPFMKAILATIGLKLKASIEFYQRTSHLFSSYFYLEENLQLFRIHPYLPQRCLHNTQHNPLVPPYCFSYLILILPSFPFLRHLSFPLIVLLALLHFLYRLHSPLYHLSSLLNHHLLPDVDLSFSTSSQ